MEGRGEEGKRGLTLAPGGTGPVHLLRTSSCPDQSLCFNRKVCKPANNRTVRNASSYVLPSMVRKLANLLPLDLLRVVLLVRTIGLACPTLAFFQWYFNLCPYSKVPGRPQCPDQTCPPFLSRQTVKYSVRTIGLSAMPRGKVRQIRCLLRRVVSVGALNEVHRIYCPQAAILCGARRGCRAEELSAGSRLGLLAVGVGVGHRVEYWM
jgi:hypothetical protein